MAKYRELYRKLGWDEARARRYRRLIDEKLISPTCRLSPRDAHVPAWQDAEHKDWEAERMAAYAAQVDSVDQSVGRVMGALRRAKADKNTLVLFLSDNGASDQAVGALDTPGQTWRIDGTPTRVGNTPDVPPGPADTFVTGGPAWANVSNTPFRRHKVSNHEGGIATPLIAWWPGTIEHAGAVTHELGHLVDIMATCLDVAGVVYPTVFNGRTVLPPAGKSLVPVFRGGRSEGHAMLAWATRGSRAVRMGRWKLVAAPDGPWELYDMETDRTELNDLANQQRDRVRAMARAFDQWRGDASAK
jgi:arylsulfatase